MNIHHKTAVFFIFLFYFIAAKPYHSPSLLEGEAELGRMDSNHDSETQILVSYHWTTSQNLLIYSPITTIYCSLEGRHPKRL